MSSTESWLELLALGRYAQLFAENEIDLDVLPDLSETDLEKLGVPMGHRKKLMRAIKAMTDGDAPASNVVPQPVPIAATPEGRKPQAPQPVSEGELRHITVMFCDLAGSTRMSQRLDPEVLRELLATYQDSCAKVVKQFGGHLARYVGDGLLVYFGYPVAHEDDPERAVRAALGITEVIQQLDARHAWPGVTLAVRIGIATGRVVAGDIGSGDRREEMAIVGETPNLAARLHELAEPGTVVISASTERLLGGQFDHRDLGPKKLKGMSEPVRAFQVVGDSDAPSRFEAIAKRGLTSLVGREEEIALIRKRWEQAKDADGQVVMISGEPGVGKSRLLREFRALLKEPHNRILYYGSSYHQNTALYPIFDQFSRVLRPEKGDGRADKLAMLEHTLTVLGLSASEMVPVLASMLSISLNESYRPHELSPQELRRKTTEYLIAIVEAMSAQSPTLIVVEDLHWVDPSTLELLRLLTERLRTLPILLLGTHRPEFDFAWHAQTYLTSFALNRLSRKESAMLVSNLTGAMKMSSKLIDQVVEKTDGVPLFLEEMIKSIVESSSRELVENEDGSGAPIAIPASLQDSLMARLDRLAPVKELAQLAATFGRIFSRELLAAVATATDDELDAALEQLVNAELIYRRGLPPDVVYEFKHALVRDTAYESLLRHKRKQYHRQIAQAIESRFPDIVATQPELLAYHFEEAGQVRSAIDYWERAGHRSIERSANQEAISHLTKALHLVRTSAADGEMGNKELSLQVALGPPLVAIKGYGDAEVEQCFLKALALCERIDNAPQHFTVLRGLWGVYAMRGESRKAHDMGEELLEEARGRQDQSLILEAHQALAFTQYWRGDFVGAKEHLHQVKLRYDTIQHGSHAYVYGVDPGVAQRFYQGRTLWHLGFPDQALQSNREAVELANKLGHPHSLAWAMSFLTSTHQLRSDRTQTRKFAVQTISISEEHGFPQWRAWGIVLHGWSLMDEGKPAIERIIEGLGEYCSTGARVATPYFLVLVADVYRHLGLDDEALTALDQAFAAVRATGNRSSEAEIYRLKGELGHGASASGDAECYLLKSLETAREQAAKSLELRAAMSLVRSWQQRGRKTESRKLLAPVYEWFTEGFDTIDYEQAGTLLSEIS